MFLVIFGCSTLLNTSFDNGKATNSPNYRYRITPEFLTVIQSISDNENCVCEESASLAQFLYKHDTLSNLYASKKRMQKMPVKINDKDLRLDVSGYFWLFYASKYNSMILSYFSHFAKFFFFKITSSHIRNLIRVNQTILIIS